MNNAVKSIIIFASGVAVGAVSMYFGVKKYFQIAADLEVESVKKAYTDRLADIEPPKSSIDNPEIKDDKEIGKMGVKSSIVRDLNNKPPMKSYTSYYKENGAPNLDGVKEIVRDPKEALIDEDLAAESQSPPEDEPYTDEEDDAAQADYEMHKINEEHQKALEENRLPYIIDRADFELTCAHYSKISLHYYVSDDVVATDEDEIIDESVLLGDTIISSGFNSDSEDILYVRNDIRGADYEVEKIFAAFPG